MTSCIEQELRTFATKLLERRGGLVEWDSDDAGSAVVPEDLAATLDVDGEMVHLCTRLGGDGWCLNLATDFLDTAAQLLKLEPRVGTFRVRELYLKRGNLDEAVRNAFSWPNAKVQMRETRAVRVEYHTWWFHALLVSDDRWETRLPITLNASTGAEVELPELLDLWEFEPHPAARREPPSNYRQAVRRAQLRLRESASGFLDRMDARFERDRKRLRQYYNALLLETDHKKSRARTKPDPEEREAKKRAVRLELRRKSGELAERYAMELTLEPLILTRMEIPALAVDLSVQRKRAKRTHTVYWNPLLKQLEPVCCSRCGCGTFTVIFTNDDVDPLCAACSG